MVAVVLVVETLEEAASSKVATYTVPPSHTFGRWCKGVTDIFHALGPELLHLQYLRSACACALISNFWA